MFVESLGAGEGSLPGELLVSGALVPVENGHMAVPVLNVGGVNLVSEQVGEVREQQELPAEVVGMEFPGLTGEQIQKVRQLLGKHARVFAKSETDLGCTNVIEHEIPVVDEAPVRQRYRRIPPSQYEEVKAHIAQLLQHGIIRESSSPYSSPLVIVRKKNGSLRLCVDYRQLNAKTRRDAFPLPRIEESLDALGVPGGFPLLTWPAGTIRWGWLRRIVVKLLSAPRSGCMSSPGCRLVSVMPQVLSSG